jgi:site-specific DNA recombinase
MKEQNRITFGYNRSPSNKIETNEGQAAAINLIYSWYAEGDSIGTIKERLESAMVPSPQNKPKWGKQSLHNILTYDRYLGDGVYPKILDEELYQKVQMIMQTKAK